MTTTASRSPSNQWFMVILPLNPARMLQDTLLPLRPPGLHPPSWQWPGSSLGVSFLLGRQGSILLFFLPSPGGLQDLSFPDQGSNLCPQQWKGRVLTTGLLGKSLSAFIYFFYHILICNRGFPVAQLVKHTPAMREIWVQSLGWEDPLEKGKATNTLAT